MPPPAAPSPRRCVRTRSCMSRRNNQLAKSRRNPSIPALVEDEDDDRMLDRRRDRERDDDRDRDGDDEEEGSGVNPVLVVHSLLRGRYLWALLLAVVLGGVGAFVAFNSMPL